MIDDAVNLPVNPVFGNRTVPAQYISSARKPDAAEQARLSGQFHNADGIFAPNALLC